TGKGLSDLIREHFGLRITVFVLLGLLAADLGNTVAEFAGIASSGEIFGISKYLLVPLSGLFVWWLIVKGSFKVAERVFLAGCVFYVSYILSGLLAHVPWHPVLRSTLMPTFSFKPSYIAMFIGVVGTTIAPWMQFYLQSAVVEKRITPEKYPLSRLDVVLGCFMTDIVAWFIIVACAVTIHAHGIAVHDAKDVSLALEPLAGNWAGYLFGFGLFNASLLSASILPLATAYYICEGMGWEAGIDRTWREAPWFISLYTALLVVGGGVVLLPHAPLLAIMFWSQVANGVLLPFVLVFMLILINKKRIMGPFVNGRGLNAIAWATAVVIIGLTLMLVVTSVFPTLLPQA
ncbi:MAG: divalent metal cation transporter, partial [Cyanobacteria bacterium REEB65]|nr:divalent metal cation transporter [Cyanobacteria bacterium REEB65]